MTSDPYFRLTATICGIHVVDCWKLAVYHKLIMQDEMGISKFAGILGFQHIKLANTLNVLNMAFKSPFGGHSCMEES